MKRTLARLRPLGRNEDGSIAVEFALIAPVLMLILAGVVDLGNAASVRLSLNARVTAAADYALVQPAPSDQAGAMAMAGAVLSLLQGRAAETATVVVNNAARAEWDGSGASITAAGGAAQMCYCPTLSGGAVQWGAAVACGSACGSGDTAGQFVQISAAARHSAILPGYAFLEGDMVRTHAVLRLQ